MRVNILHTDIKQTTSYNSANVLEKQHFLDGLGYIYALDSSHTNSFPLFKKTFLQQKNHIHKPRITME